MNTISNTFAAIALSTLLLQPDWRVRGDGLSGYSLAEAGVGAGFDLAGYSAQASFLINSGLPERLAAIETIEDPVARLARTNEVKRLTLPGEMGERFQAMAFQRGVDIRPLFARGDLSRRL